MQFNAKTLTSVVHIGVACASGLIAAGIWHVDPQIIAALLAVANATMGGKDVAASQNGG